MEPLCRSHSAHVRLRCPLSAAAWSRAALGITRQRRCFSCSELRRMRASRFCSTVQITGQPSVLYYSNAIFASAGFGAHPCTYCLLYAGNIRWPATFDMLHCNTQQSALQCNALHAASWSRLRSPCHRSNAFRCLNDSACCAARNIGLLDAMRR